MFVRAKFAQAVLSNAFLVPQTALSRDANGGARVFVLGAGNKAVQRAVIATRTVGANWVVTAGLKPGHRVLTQGLGKVKPGQLVKPVPETAPQTPGSRSAKPGGAKSATN